MNRRFDNRYPAALQATVADLAIPDRVATGQIVDVSQSGLCAVIQLQFAMGTIVKVRIGDSALFGHVTYCQEDGARFRTGIELVRVLIGESDLSRIVNAMLVEAMPNTPGVRPDISI
jgi:hypothetical protein